MSTTAYHTPVLADAVAVLARGRLRAVDATVGGGGHAVLLRAAGAEVLAVDRDAEALAASRARLGDSVSWMEGSFGSAGVIGEIVRFAPDLVLLDLGVSSRQLDADARGFSFRPGVPLDMRMSNRGANAADLLNSAPQDEIAHIFRTYGDERRAARLARTIVERRTRKPLTVSDDLVNAIRRALGPTAGPSVFARLFQAVRIAVNRELDELETALPVLRDALTPGGKLAAITYHSGEDRIVKHAFREWARSCICPPGQPICTCRGAPLGTLTPRRPIFPSADEIAANPRARSAKLRVFERTHGS